MRAPLVLVGFAFVATANGGAVPLPQQVQNALTPIDTVPTKTQLDAVFSDQALQNLTAIAADQGTNTGIRLRAIHALGKYCTSPCLDGDTAHQALTTFITANSSATSGEIVVMLRGAIEAVGPQRVATDITLLLTLLDHQSRDIRAAAVHALRDLCNTQAIIPLRNRNEHEPTDQVRQAITDALRVLGQPQPCQ